MHEYRTRLKRTTNSSSRSRSTAPKPGIEGSDTPPVAGRVPRRVAAFVAMAALVLASCGTGASDPSAAGSSGSTSGVSAADKTTKAVNASDGCGTRTTSGTSRTSMITGDGRSREYVLHVRVDERPRSTWKRLDFREYDASCLGIIVDVGRPEHDLVTILRSTEADICADGTTTS